MLLFISNTPIHRLQYFSTIMYVFLACLTWSLVDEPDVCFSRDVIALFCAPCFRVFLSRMEMSSTQAPEHALLICRRVRFLSAGDHLLRCISVLMLHLSICCWTRLLTIRVIVSIYCCQNLKCLLVRLINYSWLFLTILSSGWEVRVVSPVLRSPYLLTLDVSVIAGAF